MPRSRAALRDRLGHRRPAQARERHETQVLLGEVRVVEQAGEEVGRTAGHAELAVEHQAKDGFGVPGVDEVHRTPAQQRHDQRVQHADEVADRRGGDLRRAADGEHPVELTRLEAERVVGVHDALRVSGRAGGEADECRFRRIDLGGSIDRPSDRRGVEQVREADRGARQRRGGFVADDDPRGYLVTDHQLAVQREVVDVPEARGRHHRGGARHREDVVDLLRAVEVHDRHHHRTQVDRRPEGDAGLGPVRQLHHHHVAGADATGAQRRGEGSGGPVDVAERAGPWSHRGVHVEVDLGHGPESVGHDLAERTPLPVTLGPVALGQLVGDPTQTPPAIVVLCHVRLRHHSAPPRCHRSTHGPPVRRPDRRRG